jgi:hypothetical protein
MSMVTRGMIGGGIAALVAGLFLVRARFAEAAGTGSVYADRVRPVLCRLYLRLLCDRALSLFRGFVPGGPLGKHDVGLGAGGDTACLYRWHNFGVWQRFATKWAIWATRVQFSVT